MCVLMREKSVDTRRSTGSQNCKLSANEEGRPVVRYKSDGASTEGAAETKQVPELFYFLIGFRYYASQK